MNKKYLQFVVFVCLFALAFVLRVYHIGKFGLFGDEKQSVLLAVGNTNIGGMVDLMRPDTTFTPSDFWAPRGIQAWLKADASGDVSGNSLLHDMALKVSAFLFGKGDAVFRGVSVFFNLLTLMVLYIWAKRLKWNLNWALAVLAIATIEPFFVIFSQQARNYTCSLFFTTLSNYYYWLILSKKEGATPPKKYFSAWALASLGALFSTYLTALVLIGQLIFLFFHWPNTETIKRFFIASIFILVPFGLWMTLGPGQYFLIYQADAAQQYRDYIQNHGEIAGWIEASTPIHLFKRTVSILSDQFIWTNDLYNSYGFKIGAILLLLFGVVLRNWLKKMPKEERKFYLFGFLQIGLPVLVLFFSAINAQTTTGFFLRYASFGLPFGIFISLGLVKHVLKQHIWVRILAGLFLMTQVYTFVKLIKPLYRDGIQKYTFSIGREENPYPVIAKKIQSVYQSGDTVFYPSRFNNFLASTELAKLNVDVADAQLVNLYLRPDEKFIQKIDTTNKDSVLIRGKNGRRLLIFDFKNGRYRY
ncbi:MAG: hypothetical protein ACKOWQ_09025 [Aquirufa sp.]